MDKRLGESIKILNALEVYFENISSYLHDNDPDRYQRLVKLTEKASQIKKELASIVNEKMTSMETIFKLSHWFYLLGRMMTRIYAEMNFTLPISEELSKTKVYRLMSIFDDITNVYKLYIKDLSNKNAEMVDILFVGMDQKFPLESVQGLFHKYPFAIDLYVKYMKHRLNAGDQDVLRIIEIDKSHVLGEPKWTSPFLSFNLHPLDQKFYELKEIAQKIGSNESKLDKMANNIGIIAWHREQPAGVIYHLPIALDFTRGLCTQDSMTPLETLEAKTYKWDVKIFGDAKEYLCIETLDGVTWRILTETGKLLTQRTTIAKLLNRQNGRPQAYNSKLEKAFLRCINPHIRGAFSKDMTKRDIQPHIQKVHTGLLRWFQEEKGTVAERIQGANEILRELLLKEIDTDEIETFLYTLSSLENQFQKDFAKRTIPSGSKDEQTIWFAKESKEILSALIKKHENIFQILHQKAYLKNNLQYQLPTNKS